MFVAQSLLFIGVTRHHYAWSYPRGYDQLQYLGEAYGGFERARQQGFAEGAWLTLTHVSAQGSLHGFLALLVFEVAGPSRTAALTVNLLGFLLWQAATFLAVRRLTGSFSMAWAAVGLLAAFFFPWSASAGSAVDFRLDWMAACAYGVALAAGVAANGFRSTRWAALFGAAVGIVMLTRFLTAVYFGLVFLILFAGLFTQPGRLKRCVRLILSGAVALGIAAPAIWRSRHLLYDYYWLDHFAGPARALNDSHFGAIASLRWLLSQLVFGQVGLAALLLGLGAAGALLALGHFSRASSGAPGPPARAADGAGWFASAFFAAPALVLLLHPIKAPQTLCILLPGVLWFTVLAWIRCARRVGPKARAAVCGSVAALGALVFVGFETNTRDADRRAPDDRTINALSDYVFFRAEEAGLSQPRVAVTWLLESLSAESFQLLGYERHQRYVPFTATLPTGLFATDEANIGHGLGDSDFVCLVTRAQAFWPFDRQMAERLPQTRAWCDAHLNHVGNLDTDAFEASIYERRTLRRPAGSAVALASMVDAGSRGSADANAVPPAAPVFVSPTLVLGSTAVEFRSPVPFAAYSPITYRVTGLPAGLMFDGGAGQIRGRSERTGDFVAKITASNLRGATSKDLRLHIEDHPSFAFVEAPKTIGRNIPVTIDFGAFDSAGQLDFIDVTDLSAGKTLDRLAADENQKQTWLGDYRVAFPKAGSHQILFRVVRFDPTAPAPYSFEDHSFEIEVSP